MAHYLSTIVSLLLLLTTVATYTAAAASDKNHYHYYVHRSSGGEEELFHGMVGDSDSPSPSPAPFDSTPPVFQPPPSDDTNSNWNPDKYQRIVYRGLQTVPACNALRYGSCIGQALNVQKKCDFLNRSCIR